MQTLTELMNSSTTAIEHIPDININRLLHMNHCVIEMGRNSLNQERLSMIDSKVYKT